MTMISVLSFIGGLALLFYGMQVMSGSLRRLADSKLSRILANMTSSPVKGVLWGTGITALIQSSSAVTVTVVGLTNAGMICLRQAIAVILGANIGTTLTAWILSLTGIESTNLILQLFKPVAFSPLLAVAGIGMVFFAKKSHWHNVGSSLLGLALMLFGMVMMSNVFLPLAENGALSSLLLRFDNPLFCLAAGIAATAILQSSSMVTGILQAVAISGLMPLSFAVPALLGAEIGTCVTALISSVGTTAEARRAAVSHLLFNVIGVAVFFLLYAVIYYAADLAIFSAPISAVGIAALHFLFNVVTVLCFLPFLSQFEALATRLVKEKNNDSFNAIKLEERFLSSPSLAAKYSKEAILEMMSLVHENIIDALNLLYIYDASIHLHMKETKKMCDEYEKKLRRYLTALGRKELSAEDGNALTEMISAEVLLRQLGQSALRLASFVGEEAGKEERETACYFEMPYFATACEGVRRILNDVFAALSTKKNDGESISRQAAALSVLRENAEKYITEQLKNQACEPQIGIDYLIIMAELEKIGFCCAELSSLVSCSEPFSAEVKTT